MFRIIQNNTNEKYYIQKKVRFLFWHGWSFVQTKSVPCNIDGSSYYYAISFETYDDAKKYVSEKVNVRKTSFAVISTHE